MKKISQILIIFLLLHCVTPPEETVEKPAPITESETKISKELEESKYNEWKKENLAQQKENSQKFLKKNKIKLDKNLLFYEDKISFGMTQIEVLEISGYSYKEIMELANKDDIDSMTRYTTVNFPEFTYHFKENLLYSVSSYIIFSTPEAEVMEALKYKYGKPKINSRIWHSDGNVKYAMKIDEHTWLSNNTEIIGNFCYLEDEHRFNQFLKKLNECSSYGAAVANLDILYRNKNISAIIEKEKAETEKNKIKEKAKKI